MIDNNKIIENLEKRLSTFTANPKTQNVGIVEKNTDGVVSVSGISKAFMGEIIEFQEGSRGVVLNLDEDRASIILFNNGLTIQEGMSAKTTGQGLNIKVSEELLGRVVNPMGISLDGKPEIKKGKEMPLERIAAGVVERQPVDTPLKTGIKSIDAMFPIGRGQRELIIGDRGLGKTAVAVDAIINQRKQGKGLKPVISIYVAIGQKQNTVARVVDKLKQEDAFANTIVVVAGASDPATLQYLAPYAGVAVAEYFMEKGQDVLIVYDDLTKHSWAYRQLSLILRRPAGREAYPGDIFYLHSRLLERAVKLNKENGNGSITALPIIETQAGDISAYIPTNVISITDGQIFLEADLFNSGVRPAINAGFSVSRVGGNAQIKSMKKVAGTLKLDQALYREMEAFSKFGGDLDAATKLVIDKGARNVEILKQAQYSPFPVERQVAIIYLGTQGLLRNVAVRKVKDFEDHFLMEMENKMPDLLAEFKKGNLPDDGVKRMVELANTLIPQYK